VPAPVALGPGPVLGAVHGWTVVSFDGVTLGLLDLDTGATTRFVYEGTGAVKSTVMLADRFMYTDHGGAPTVWSQRYRDEPPTLVQQDASIITTSVEGRVWVALNQAGVNGELLVAEIDGDGRRLTLLTIPNGLRVVGPISNGLWLTGSGRIFVLARDGVLQDVAIGAVIDASVNGLLYDDCAIAGPCTLRIVSPTARQSRLGPSAELRLPATPDSTDSPVSPNGRWLLLADGVLDRRTGAQVSHTFDLRAWRWSPDGDWLFVSTTGGATVAWNLIDGRQLPLPGIGPLSGVVAR